MADISGYDYGTLAALLVAAIELKEVQDIRQAVRANLIAAGGVPGALGTITMPHHRSETHGAFGWRDSDDRHGGVTVQTFVSQKAQSSRLLAHSCEQRPGCTPRAAFRDDTTRQANRPAASVDPAARVEAEPPLGERLTPLVPPWRLPLPIESAGAVRVIRWEAPKPDLMHKGQLVDLFL